MPVISGSITKSGITNHSPRVSIRERDDNPGRYPSKLSSADYDRRGKTKTPFDATLVINYLTQSSNISDMTEVQYPVKLFQNQLNKLGPFATSPNTNSNLKTTGSILRGVSDNILDIGHMRGYSTQASTSAGAIGWVKSTNSWINEEPALPFTEDRININDTAFYQTGSNTTGAKLSGRLQSKISFKVNISTDQERIFTRASQVRLNQADPEGEFFNQDITGFCYYNFNTKKWDQLGLTDPATGKPTHFDYATENRGGPSTVVAGQINIHSGTNNYANQFKPSSHTEPRAGQAARIRKGYNRIGVPTITALAPFSTKYHATASQALKMSSFIDHPFVLEKVVVNLPIRAQRKHRFLYDDNKKARTDCRDQDDYVFFMYRQQRSLSSDSGPDSKFDVSGSQRFLICSGVMTFYNNKVRKKEQNDSFDFFPENNSAFSHDFNMPVPADTADWKQEYTGSFTGSISLNIEPAVATSQYTGITIVQEAGGDPGGSGREKSISLGYSKIRNYWPGGTTTKPFLQHKRLVDSSGKTFIAPSKYTGKVGVTASYGTPTFDKFAEIDGPNQTASDLPIEIFDPRSFIPFGGSSAPETNAFGTSVGSDTSRAAPYIIMPEDEIIFGIDSAIAISGIDSSFSSSMTTNLTSSRLSVDPGPASVTFFGTVLRDGIADNTLSINQQLTSDAVHEVIQDEFGVSDQYDIELPTAFSGTYIDLTFRSGKSSRVEHGLVSSGPAAEGSNLKISRYVVGSFAGGTQGTTGSLLRGIKVSDSEERYYDTVMPAINNFIGRISDLHTVRGGHFTIQPYISPEQLESGSILSEFSGSLPHPYDGNPNRRIYDNTTYQLGDDPNGQDFRIFTDAQKIRKTLFSVGWEVKDENDNIVRHFSRGVGNGYAGSTGMRYGVLSYDPLYTSAVFRRDGYGQFRDMLEQRKYAKFYGRELVQGTEGPVMVKFVQRLTNDEMKDGKIVGKNKDSSSTDAYGTMVVRDTQSHNLNLFASSSVPYSD